MKFEDIKVGMRVKAVSGFDGNVGTVISMRDKAIGVEFDKDIDGHDSSAVGEPGKDGHCWNFRGQSGADCLEPVEDEYRDFAGFLKSMQEEEKKALKKRIKKLRKKMEKLQAQLEGVE